MHVMDWVHACNKMITNRHQKFYEPVIDFYRRLEKMLLQFYKKVDAYRYRIR